jgi:hypothetical protein
MKTRRYTLKALPERTIVMIPLVGERTLLSQLNHAIRSERIPRDAKVRLLTHYGVARSLRFEFVE